MAARLEARTKYAAMFISIYARDVLVRERSAAQSWLAADQPEEARAHGLPVTVTIGIAEWQQEEMSELVSRADHALYGGKAAGRDTARVSTVMAAVTEAPNHP